MIIDYIENTFTVIAHFHVNKIKSAYVREGKQRKQSEKICKELFLLLTAVYVTSM